MDTWSLGIEFGSTRIKAVLVDEHLSVIATGSHTWENQLIDGYWSYPLDAVWAGVREAYAELNATVEQTYGAPVTTLASIGISAMMHGYLPFSATGEQLAGFRSGRNTTTAAASEELTGLLAFAVPQRWSIAHLYQAVLNGEAHVPQIAYLTTLGGYIHWQLTGEKT
ncbi:MAG: ATPase, partial [Propionibacteriaceae bacterium]|nr:ATPase [Propionibacteriaceae bacterium]